ncbi:hypothetical protein Hanom_Chr17g01525811 [Helianthus anomalus]
MDLQLAAAGILYSSLISSNRGACLQIKAVVIVVTWKIIRYWVVISNRFYKRVLYAIFKSYN